MVKYILRLGRMHEFLNVKVLDTGLPLLCGFHFRVISWNIISWNLTPISAQERPLGTLRVAIISSNGASSRIHF